MTEEEFRRTLKKEKLVPLSRDEWEALASRFPELERHSTQLAGDLLIIEVDGDLVAVEEPSPRARVARRLGDRDDVDDFVSRRMEEYERMWDGCGVKVEYYDE